MHSCSTTMRDDHEFNIYFVQVIEKHKYLYDHTLPEYSNRELQDKAWHEVSDDVQESVSNCKERWRNLRGCLTRHLNHRAYNEKIRKPYYLIKYMEFVIPFTKSRKYMKNQSILSVELETISDYEETGPSVGKVEHEEAYEDDYSENNELNSTCIVAKRKSPDTPAEETNRSVEYVTEKKIKTDLEQKGETDLFFFKSILPDIYDMDSGQKRKLRIGILKLIDDILKPVTDESKMESSTSYM